MVAADETEQGLRRVLNFGHTLGHAVESLTGYSALLHGEAVAIGMAFAARLSQRSGSCTAGEADRVVALLERAGLPVRIPPALATDALAGAVAGDKKVSGGQVKFVLMAGLGSPRFARLGMADIAAHVAALRGA